MKDEAEVVKMILSAVFIGGAKLVGEFVFGWILPAILILLVLSLTLYGAMS